MSAQEYNRSFEYWLDDYYRFLGRRLLVEHGRAFWSYHAKTLEKLGGRLDRKRLLKAALGQIWSLLRKPGHTLESMKRFSALRKIRSAKARQIVSTFKVGGTGETDLPLRRS
jgi:hypothetical protein